MANEKHSAPGADSGDETQDRAAANGTPGGEGDTDDHGAMEPLRAQLETAIAEKDKYHRAYSDAVDFSRRAGERHAVDVRYATVPVLTQLLSALDDLERAFGSIPEAVLRLTWVEGILLIYRKLQSTLEANGVTEIQSADAAFDPNVHEAISRVAGPEGQIVEVLQKGYMLHDRVLRPALVQVGGATEPRPTHEDDTSTEAAAEQDTTG